jgi:hypothetical protein
LCTSTVGQVDESEIGHKSLNNQKHQLAQCETRTTSVNTQLRGAETAQSNSIMRLISLTTFKLKTSVVEKTL